jgi:hypothetical protein
MRCDELAARLGITKQRVYQLAVRLYADGFIRLGDESKPLHVIARRNDPTLLLSYEQEHVLSVMPREFATTLSKIRVAANLSEELAEAATRRLLVAGLIEEMGGRRAKGSTTSPPPDSPIPNMRDPPVVRRRLACRSNPNAF